MSKISAAALLAGALALGACQTTAGGGTTIEGQWASNDGISVSKLERGRVVTRAIRAEPSQGIENNEVLATGSYGPVEDGRVTINLFSLVQQKNSSAVCALEGADRMTCSLEGGSFTLIRVA